MRIVPCFSKLKELLFPLLKSSQQNQAKTYQIVGDQVVAT